MEETVPLGNPKVESEAVVSRAERLIAGEKSVADHFCNIR